MMAVLVPLLESLHRTVRSRAALQLEVFALRHQLQVLQRRTPRRVRLTNADRWLWVWLSCLWTGWRTALVIVKPATVIAWHRRGFRLLWTWKSRRRTGRPTVPLAVRTLIRTMSEANPLWGAPRIHGELLKLGIEVGQASVAKYMIRRRQPPSQTWRSFLRNHIGQIVAADFFVVPTATYRLLFVLILLAHDRRRIVHVAVTSHPTAMWTAQQLRDAFPWDEAPRFFLHDRDHAFGNVTATVMGMCDVLTAARSPPRLEGVHRVLRTITHAPVIEQGRTDLAPDRHAGRRSCGGDPAGWRASSPVRAAGGLTSLTRLPDSTTQPDSPLGNISCAAFDGDHRLTAPLSRRQRRQPPTAVALWKGNLLVLFNRHSKRPS
jgi:putative transposase